MNLKKNICLLQWYTRRIQKNYVLGALLVIKINLYARRFKLGILWGHMLIFTIWSNETFFSLILLPVKFLISINVWVHVPPHLSIDNRFKMREWYSSFATFSFLISLIKVHIRKLCSIIPLLYQFYDSIYFYLSKKKVYIYIFSIIRNVSTSDTFRANLFYNSNIRVIQYQLFRLGHRYGTSTFATQGCIYNFVLSVDVHVPNSTVIGKSYQTYIFVKCNLRASAMLETFFVS